MTVEHRQWPGALHGFFQFPNLFTEGADAVAAAASALKRQLADAPRTSTTAAGSQ